MPTPHHRERELGSRIEELQAEIAEQASRETAWANKFDDQVRHFGVVMHNLRRRLLLEHRADRKRLRSEIERLNKQVAELQATGTRQIEKIREIERYRLTAATTTSLYIEKFQDIMNAVNGTPDDKHMHWMEPGEVVDAVAKLRDERNDYREAFERSQRRITELVDRAGFDA